MTLDNSISTAEAMLKHSRTESLQLHWARTLISLRFKRGDFPIAVLDAALLEVMARATVREVWGE